MVITIISINNYIISINVSIGLFQSVEYQYRVVGSDANNRLGPYSQCTMFTLDCKDKNNFCLLTNTSLVLQAVPRTNHLHNVTVFNEQYNITKLTCDNNYTISVTSLLCEVEKNSTHTITVTHIPLVSPLYCTTCVNVSCPGSSHHYYYIFM